MFTVISVNPTVMADVQDTRNALWRRDEQIRRWNLSETNSVSSESRDLNKTAVKFQDGCVFLAACSSSDKNEIEKLVKRGADINTTNIDGLTALHQVLIEFFMNMTNTTKTLHRWKCLLFFMFCVK